MMIAGEELKILSEIKSNFDGSIESVFFSDIISGFQFVKLDCQVAIRSTSLKFDYCKGATDIIAY